MRQILLIKFKPRYFKKSNTYLSISIYWEGQGELMWIGCRSGPIRSLNPHFSDWSGLIRIRFAHVALSYHPCRSNADFKWFFFIIKKLWFEKNVFVLCWYIFSLFLNIWLGCNRSDTQKFFLFTKPAFLRMWGVRFWGITDAEQISNFLPPLEWHINVLMTN